MPWPERTASPPPPIGRTNTGQPGHQWQWGRDVGHFFCQTPDGDPNHEFRPLANAEVRLTPACSDTKTGGSNVNLHTISTGGFSAVADAFSLDDAGGLWFLSMVGSQTALKAIWAAVLKQPPEPAWLIQGAGNALVGDYRQCAVPYDSLGTWTARMTRLPGCGAYHALVYTRLAEYAFEREDFLLLCRVADEAQDLHYRFLDRRLSLPLHPGWAPWLWKRGLRIGEIQPVDGEGILAYRCVPDQEALRTSLGRAVAGGELSVPPDAETRRNGQRPHDNFNQVPIGETR